MRAAHGWHVVVLIAMLFATQAAAGPQRVVSASLCTDEYIFRLLPRSRIAALSFLSADTHPIVSTIALEVRGIPLVHASTEEILARRPDLVVMYAGTEPRLHAQLREAGVPAFDVPWAQSLSDIRGVTLDLGRALGVERRAQALLAQMDSRLARLVRPAPPVRTLIYEPNGYATADGVTDEIMHAAGLVDASQGEGATRAGTVPVENVVASPPELLLLNGAEEEHPALADLVLGHPALASLKSRVMVAHVALTSLLCPGPWSADAVAPLADFGRRARRLALSRRRP